MAEHVLEPSPQTVRWGFLDSASPPVLTVDSGDIVTMRSVSGAPAHLPPADFAAVDPAHRAIHAALTPHLGPHILTGPVAVRGARPGDALRVDILSVELTEDWGYNLIRPLAGALPDDFPVPDLAHIAIDRARGVVRLPWGLELPVAPFFGVMGVAPPSVWGPQSSIAPRRFGGNIDCKELVAGSSLVLPVLAEGALFHAGDGHALQGDGEVCVTAVECGLRGRFRLTVEPGAAPERPWAETPTHLIALAFDPDLDRAAETALRDMIGMMVARTGLRREDAYRLCSLACDLRITQLVNQHKGAHAMLPKAALAA
jgi:acetamidase/formamidase